MKKNPIGRLVAMGLVAAITLAVTVGAASAWPPKGSFLIDGKPEHPMLLSTEEIADLLATTNPHVYTVTFQAGTAVETHTFTGYLLYDVLTFLGPKFDPAVRNDKLRFYASATGSDGYQAIVAWGEFDPIFENKAVLLAFTQDGKSLAGGGPRLVVPGDIRGGRYVSDVVSIRLERALPDPVVEFLPLGP
jgi:hypothetical protein